jgi:hypothetical protein
LAHRSHNAVSRTGGKVGCGNPPISALPKMQQISKDDINVQKYFFFCAEKN